MQLGNCTGKFIQRNLGKHIALFHMELAQLWRCPVTSCTVWKGTAQDCVDHLRKTHEISQSVKAANLARYFPPWTVTRSQWSEMTRPAISGVAIDTLLFSRIGVPLFHRYRIVSRGGLMWPSAEHICDSCMPFWRKWMKNGFVVIIAGVLRRWRHVCRCHQVGTQQTVRRMFLLDTQSLDGWVPRPNGRASQCAGRVFLCLGHGFPASGGGVHGPSIDGLGTSSLCRVGGRASAGPRAMGDVD